MIYPLPSPWLPLLLELTCMCRCAVLEVLLGDFCIGLGWSEGWAAFSLDVCMICLIYPKDICSNSTFSAKPFHTPDFFFCLWTGNTSSSCRPYSLRSPTNYVLSLFIFCCPLEHSSKRMSMSVFSLYYLCPPPTPAPMKNCLVLHRPSNSSVG